MQAESLLERINGAGEIALLEERLGVVETEPLVLRIRVKGGEEIR